MSMIDGSATPLAGHVLGEALRRFLGDKMFWGYAVPLALLLAALSAFLPKHQTVAATIAFCFTLDHWLKRMLVPDWDKRIPAKAKWMQSFSWASVGFCLLYGLGLMLLPLALAFSVGLGLRSLTEVGGMLALIVFQSITMIVLAAVFGSALLFLPARVVGMDWNVGDAVRSAAGLRGTLIAVALTCSAISIGGMVLGLATIVGWNIARLAGGPWSIFAGRAVVVFVDMLALYVVAHSLSRLFVARTGWTPPPLPGDRPEPSLTA